MKKIIVLFLSIISFNLIIAQSCFPDGITFENQQEIDDFAINYPNCTEIEGDLRFDSFLSSSITSLEGLIQITRIGGDANIWGLNIIDLKGLDNITEIGGTLSIIQNENLESLNGLNNLQIINGELYISKNHKLLNFQGLDKLEYTNDFSVVFHYNIINFVGLESLKTINNDFSLSNNFKLINFNGLQNLKYIGDLNIGYNSELEDISALSNVNIIRENLGIGGCPKLQALKGLENISSLNQLGIASSYLQTLEGLENLCQVNKFICINNNMLDNLDNLINLKSVSEEMEIRGNDLLTSIYFNDELISAPIIEIKENPNLKAVEGFHSVESLEYLEILDNDSLINLIAFDGLDSISNFVTIENNLLLNNFDAFNNLRISRFLKIANNGLEDINGFNNIEIFYSPLFTTTDLIIITNNPNLKRISGFNKIKRLPSTTISENPELIEIIGFNNVERTGSLRFDNNESLNNIIGFGNVNQIGTLTVKNNDSINDFEGLNKLNIIEKIIIENNDNLINFQGLEKLDTINNDFYIRNNISLLNFEGLDQLSTISREFEVRENPSLVNFNGLEKLKYISSFLVFTNESLINFSGLDSLETIYSYGFFANLSIRNFQGLDNLKRIRKADIRGNNKLENFYGLGSLTTVDDLDIIENDSLLNFEGLDKLEHVIEFDINNNSSLYNFEGLNSFEKNYWINIEENNSMLNLDGLENLDTIESGIFIRDNESISNINALDNAEITKQNGDLILQNNPVLSECSNLLVCKHLSNGGDYVIEGNAGNCQSVELIGQFCFDGLGKIAYSAFVDYNQNGIMDGLDHFYSNGSIQINPDVIDVYSTSTDWDDFLIDYNDYTISFDADSTWLFTTGESIEISLNEDNICDSIQFGIYPINPITNNNTFISNSLPRCNTTPIFTTRVYNNGQTITDGILWLEIDEQITSIETINTPDTIANPLKWGWYFQDLAPSQQFTVSIGLGIPGPPDFEIGNTIQINSIVDYTSDDEVYSSDDYTYEREILCSYDPNDKLVNPSRDFNYTLFEEDLLYTIRFQNTGNDVAYDVVIRDVLDENLDSRTFQYIESSHPDVLSISLENNRDLTFDFNNIFLPDSTSNLEGSQGHVTYMIRTKEGIPEETLIENTANIYFDQNPPIVTNTTQNLMITAFPVDDDMDGYDSVQDCDDDNSLVNPDMEEIPYDGLDNDCNGLTLDDDLDEDGFGIDEDCDDTNASINPDATEIPDNGIDEDCSGADLVTSTYQFESGEITIYPNPFSEKVIVEQSDILDAHIKIITAGGKVIHESDLLENNIIDLIEYPNGIYLLQIQTSKNQITERLIKQ